MNTIKHLILLGCSATAAFANTGGKEMRLTECPPPVQATITANARGGVVDEVKIISIENKSIYVAEVDLPRGIDLKIYISSEGKLVKTREDIRLKDAPETVRAALKGLGGKIDDVDKEVTGETVTYHADIDRRGQADLDVVLGADGTILRKTEDLD